MISFLAGTVASDFILRCHTHAECEETAVALASRVAAHAAATALHNLFDYGEAKADSISVLFGSALQFSKLLE